MSCLFCGSFGPMSREHVLPKWFGPLFPDFREVDYVRAFQRTGDERINHLRPGMAFDQTVRHFCLECNNGWMSRLEEQAKPALESLVLDEERSISAVEQLTIATWMTKTILTLGPAMLEEGREFVTEETYRWFGEHRMPLPGSICWLGRYTGGEEWPISFHFHGIQFYPEDQERPQVVGSTNGFHAVLAIGNLALCLFYCSIPEGGLADGFSSDNRALIWPATGADVWWPPKSSFDGVEALRLASQEVPT